MDPTSQRLLFAAAGNQGIVLPAIGDAFEGGYYAGLISHTADGVATHALIVAPRATGASGTGYPSTTLYSWKTAITATTGTQSTYDGASNTAAMVAAGIESHPGAKFCVDLSIGGYSDWYMPARYELDIAYFHLKPSTGNNAVTGINAYSVPPRTVNYTVNNPTQTSVTAFQSGGAEAFDVATHWSSTQGVNTQRGWRFFLSSGGGDESTIKTTAYSIRAFRKIAL